MDVYMGASRSLGHLALWHPTQTGLYTLHILGPPAGLTVQKLRH